MLEEELQRLSRLDVQLQRKDLELLELQEKQELLRTQLRCLTRGRGPEGSPQSTVRWRGSAVHGETEGRGPPPMERSGLP